MNKKLFSLILTEIHFQYFGLSSGTQVFGESQHYQETCANSKDPVSSFFCDRVGLRLRAGGGKMSLCSTCLRSISSG